MNINEIIQKYGIHIALAGMFVILSSLILGWIDEKKDNREPLTDDSHYQLRIYSPAGEDLGGVRVDGEFHRYDDGSGWIFIDRQHGEAIEREDGGIGYWHK